VWSIGKAVTERTPLSLDKGRETGILSPGGTRPVSANDLLQLLIAEPARQFLRELSSPHPGGIIVAGGLCWLLCHAWAYRRRRLS
jgi:hypothetical protein